MGLLGSAGASQAPIPLHRFPMTKYLVPDLATYLLPRGVDWEWGLPSNPQGRSSWS